MVKFMREKSILTAVRGDEAYDINCSLSKKEKDLRSSKYGLASANNLIV